MSGNIYSYCNSELFFFGDLVYIFENFYNLGHNNYLLYNLFQNIWDFDKFFFLNENLNWSLLKPIDNLQYFLNMIDVTDNFLELFHNHSLLNNRLDLFHCLVLASYLDNLFILSNNFLNLFNNDRHLNNLLHHILNVSIHVNNLWNDSFNFNNFGNLDNLLLQSLYFINFRHSDCSFNNFLHNLLGCHNLLNDSLHWYYFLNNSFNLFYGFSDVWDFPDYLSIFYVFDDFLFHFS